MTQTYRFDSENPGVPNHKIQIYKLFQIKKEFYFILVDFANMSG